MAYADECLDIIAAIERRNPRVYGSCKETELLIPRLLERCDNILQNLEANFTHPTDIRRFRLNASSVKEGIESIQRDIYQRLTTLYRYFSEVDMFVDIFEPVTIDFWWFLGREIGRVEGKLEGVLFRFGDWHERFLELVREIQDVLRVRE